MVITLVLQIALTLSFYIAGSTKVVVREFEATAVAIFKVAITINMVQWKCNYSLY